MTQRNHVIRIAALTFLITLSVGAHTASADTGVSDERVSLPDGPGSIGYHDVIIHGDLHGFSTRSDGTGIDMTPHELANYIRGQENYVPGTPIRLLSCETGAHGATAAQNLANILRVPVLAPTDTLWANGRGSIYVGPTQSSMSKHPSLWREVKPVWTRNAY
jgi:hypothetical protein